MFLLEFKEDPQNKLGEYTYQTNSGKKLTKTCSTYREWVEIAKLPPQLVRSFQTCKWKVNAQLSDRRGRSSTS